MAAAGSAFSAAAAPTAKDLAQACRDGKLDTVKELLGRGIGVNEKVEFGGTSLIHAAVSGNVGVVEYLIDEAGADIEAMTDGKTTSLMLTAEKGIVPVMKALLARRAKLEQSDRHGRTALHLASINGKKDAVVVLLEAGAAKEAACDDGNTALLLAARYGKLDVVKALVAAGCSLKAVNKAGYTALDCARHSKHKATEDYVLDAELDAE